MNNEIKEILYFLSDETRTDERFYKALDKKKCKILLDYIINLQGENKVYKIRHKLALKKLNSAMKHYNFEDKNNAIKFSKEILEGKSIDEKCYKMLNGSDK